MAKADSKPDVPQWRFCYVCLEWVHSTRKDFDNCGHADNRDFALKKYNMQLSEFDKVQAKLDSGVFQTCRMITIVRGVMVETTHNQ